MKMDPNSIEFKEIQERFAIVKGHQNTIQNLSLASGIQTKQAWDLIQKVFPEVKASPWVHTIDLETGEIMKTDFLRIKL